MEIDITVAILAQGTDKAMRSRSLLFLAIRIFLKTLFLEISDFFENNVFNFPRGLALFYRTNRVENNITVAILAQGTDRAMRSRSLLFRDFGIFRKHYFANLGIFEKNVFKNSILREKTKNTMFSPAATPRLKHPIPIELGS